MIKYVNASFDDLTGNGLSNDRHERDGVDGEPMKR